MRYLIAVGLVLISTSVYAKAKPKGKLVDVPASTVKAMTAAEKKAALAYARANGIHWRIVKDR